MSDISILKTMGVRLWKLRDASVFTDFAEKDDKYQIHNTDLNANFDVLVIFDEQQELGDYADIFFQSVFGFDKSFLYLSKSTEGQTLKQILQCHQVPFVISFVNFQELTSNLTDNVLILNNIDFKKLKNDIQYKKQVMIDVYRTSISSFRD